MSCSPTHGHPALAHAGVRLSLRQVCKRYAGGVKALDRIDLSLGNGLFGLLGPNGAGKSTLMRSLATLQSIDSGTMCFDGLDFQQQPERLRQQIGYLPQSFGVYPGVSALQLLDYLAILKGLLDKTQRLQQIDQLLQRTHLYPHRHRAVAEYSGGMRQRFGIAQALLGAPQLLIVDEPTAGLDPFERSSFHQLLSSVASQMVVILSTHIVEDVRHLCPRLAVLQHGRMQFEGSPQALIDRLQNRLWSCHVDADAPALAPAGSHLLSTRMLAGQRQLRVVAEQRPGDGFAPAQADLEDGYYYVLQAGSQVDALPEPRSIRAESVTDHA